MRKGRASGSASVSGATAALEARARSRSRSRSMRHSFSSLRPRPANGTSSKRWLRALGALGYAFSVSLVAVLLALYYTFLWTPQLRRPAPSPNAEDIVKTSHESLASSNSLLKQIGAGPAASFGNRSARMRPPPAAAGRLTGAGNVSAVSNSTASV